jgi:N-dimethylarginine dimethylaminohydrolase
MCRPTAFTVQYEINPWMSVKNAPDPRRALMQWEEVYKTFLDLGCEVEWMEGSAGLPDMVFTANAGLAFDGQAILGRFRHPERRGEEPHHERWFRDRGFTIHRLPEDLCFEGEGDFMVYKDRALMAHGFRTDPQAHPLVGKLVGREILSLKLVDPRFYHLDTCLLYVPRADLLLCYPGAFTPDSLAAIRRLPSDLIEVNEEDACLFVCNAVPVGNTLVMNRCTPGLGDRLEALGIHPHPVGTSEFLKAGGSVRCMVLNLPGGVHPEK